jgi:hypothetical protein
MPEGVGEAEPSSPAPTPELSPTPTPAFSAPPSLADMNFDDLLPVIPDPTGEQPAFSAPRPISEAFDEQSSGAQKSAPAFPTPPMADLSFDEPQVEPSPAPAPAFPAPPSMSDLSFDDPRPTPNPAPRPTPNPAPGFPGQPVANASGMGISITGGPAPHAGPAPTPAQVAATSQSLRIRLLRPDGKPFDGPEITTGPKQPDNPSAPARTGFDAAQRGPKKQAPKVVVKAGPMARLGHTLAILAISAIGIVPLGYLLLQSVHDREDKLAAHISVPTQMNVLDGTADAYLGGMAAVLMVVALAYWMRLKKRRER